MKTKETKTITTAQIKKIHVLLDKYDLIEQKQNIVFAISKGSKKSTKELTMLEAGEMINFLEQSGDDLYDHLVKPKTESEHYEKKQMAFRAIYGLAFKMGMIYGNTDDDYQMNIAKLNVFCRERGTVKKNFTSQNLAEMRRTHRQFEAMYKKFENKVKI